MRFRMIATILVLATTGGTAVLAGPMRGANGHTASGSARIDAGKVELGSDFRFDGGPDVYVAVKTDGKIQLLAKLRANDGAQSYSLPAESGGVDEILLFCKQYNVTLGTAPAK